MTGEDAAHQVIRASHALIAVIEAENAALARLEFARVGALAAAKTAAAETYEANLGAFTGQPELRETLSGTVKDALRRSCEDLANAVTANMSALRAAMELNRRLVRTIARSVENQQPAPSGYTKSGIARAEAVPQRKGTMTPVSLDETL